MTQIAPITPITPISSSALYRRASGRPAGGAPAPYDCTCVMCEGKIAKGDPAEAVTADTFGESFNNKLDIKQKIAKGSYICGDCVTLWHKDFLQNYSKSYATPKGVFKLASNDDVAALVLHAQGHTFPVVAVFSSKQQQHMIWRTPVTYSPKMLTVRVDDNVLRINPVKAIEGARAWQHIVSRCKAMGMLFVPAVLERDLSAPDMAVIRQRAEVALRHENTPENLQALDFLAGLGMGEWWALCALRHVNLDDPQTWPKPIQVLPTTALN